MATTRLTRSLRIPRSLVDYVEGPLLTWLRQRDDAATRSSAYIYVLKCGLAALRARRQPTTSNQAPPPGDENEGDA